MAGGLLESVTYRDAKGNTAQVRYFVSSAGTTVTQETAASAVFTAMNALTNAHPQAAHGPANLAPTEVIYGTNATYASVEDKAIFTFQTSTGDNHRFQIPAPKSTIFLADGETVDNTNTDVVAFVSAVVANCVGKDGVAIVFGANGTRIRRKTHRRINIFVKDPSLTEPAE